jgi:hypothetical protein
MERAVWGGFRAVNQDDVKVLAAEVGISICRLDLEI